jgi:endonuclease I
MRKMRQLRRGAQWTFVLLLLCSPELRSEPPAGYYASVDDRDPVSLRQSLHEVIDDHLRIPLSSDGSWVMLEGADEDPGDPNRILDVYKNESYEKVGGGSGPYEREHTWPSSYGFPPDAGGSAAYPSSDGHALFLANGSYNGSRGNTLYRTCDPDCDERPTVFNNGRGGGTGEYPGNSNWRRGVGSTGTWETWIGRRGDVARALFYLDVRYDGSDHAGGTAEPDLVLTDDTSRIRSDSANTQDPAYMGLLSVLLEWHLQDPVDALERRRNELIFASQGNRNPFIDQPEWVACLYEAACGTIESGEFPDFRFRVLISPGDGPAIPGRSEPVCIPETVCVSGALSGRAELFLRVIGPRPNGFLHVNLVRFTVSRVEVWIEELSTGVERHYILEAVQRPGTDLTGLVDREAFLP